MTVRLLRSQSDTSTVQWRGEMMSSPVSVHVTPLANTHPNVGAHMSSLKGRLQHMQPYKAPRVIEAFKEHSEMSLFCL